MAKPALSTDNILSSILTIRDQRVILAADLAKLYGTETKKLNQQIKRNFERFPRDFVFQLTAVEKVEALRSQNVTLEKGSHHRYLPYAFTEHGAIMAANVLSSPRAVAMSVYVVRAFIQQREVLAANGAILKRLAEIDRELLQHDAALRDIYHRLQPLLQPPPDAPRKKIDFSSGGSISRRMTRVLHILLANSADSVKISSSPVFAGAA
jgi:hypothetical protein